jgi:membrane-bound serine protease (ClpP class)
MIIATITVLILLALLLIVVEICTPTFGLLGALSVACLIWATALAFGISQVFGIVLTVVLFITVPLFVLWAVRVIPNTWLGRLLALRREQAAPGEGTPESDDLAGMVGQETVADTVLRPSGTIRVAGRRIVAQAESGFIEKGTAIKILRAAGTHVIVREIES